MKSYQGTTVRVATFPPPPKLTKDKHRRTHRHHARLHRCFSCFCFLVGVGGAKGEGRDETAGRGPSAGTVRGRHHPPRAPAVVGRTGGDRRRYVRYALGFPPVLIGCRSGSDRLFFVSASMAFWLLSFVFLIPHRSNKCARSTSGVDLIKVLL